MRKVLGFVAILVLGSVLSLSAEPRQRRARAADEDALDHRDDCRDHDDHHADDKLDGNATHREARVNDSAACCDDEQHHDRHRHTKLRTAPATLPSRSRRVEPDDDDSAWTLFENAVELQQMMTTQVRANVAANYGVSIQAPPAA